MGERPPTRCLLMGDDLRAVVGCGRVGGRFLQVASVTRGSGRTPRAPIGPFEWDLA